MHNTRHPAERGKVIVLNGPSSSGKTTLARHLQAAESGRAFVHVSLDAFRAMEPPGYWDPSVEHSWRAREEALCRAINGAVAAYARHGQNVILDHVLPQRGWTWLREDLREFPVLTIGVRCESGELARRERARGDRPIGLSARQADKVHEGRTYDLELDTTSNSPEMCAHEVRTWLARWD